jgi:hypothetical protein
VIDSGAAEVAPSLNVIVRLPDAGMTGSVVASENIGGAIAIVVAGCNYLMVNARAAKVVPRLQIVVQMIRATPSATSCERTENQRALFLQGAQALPAADYLGVIGTAPGTLARL